MAEDYSDEEEEMGVGKFVYDAVEFDAETGFDILVAQEDEDCVSQEENKDGGANCFFGSDGALEVLFVPNAVELLRRIILLN